MDSRRAVIEEHWRASESGDGDAEHAMYADDAILDYPQSGERFRGRASIAAQRGGHPAERHFTVLRIVGSGDVWVSECIITYDEVPRIRCLSWNLPAGMSRTRRSTSRTRLMRRRRGQSWLRRCRGGTSIRGNSVSTLPCT